MRLERLVAPFARSTPNALAVDGVDEAMTYAELDALANRFARTFVAAGVFPGDRVGVHLPRSARAIAAMLGAARAGAVFVPLDPGSPPARVHRVVEDAGIRHVVIAPPLFAAWVAADLLAPVAHFFLSGEGDTPVVVGRKIHAWTTTLSASAAPLALPEGSPDDLAYILYTSGSTGVPKGVMLSHRNAFAFIEWAADLVDLRASDRVASVAPFHFDLSVFDVWASLMRGATIVIVDETTVTSGRRMVDRIHDKAIDVWYSVPSAFVLMLENGGLEERGAPSLRHVFFAGEVFPMKHLRRTMAAIPNARFHNLFGPTETNVCLAHSLRGIPSEQATSIPIGVPACGDVALVVDEQGRDVPDGSVGELFIAGPTVMLGYWAGGARSPARHPYPTGDLVVRRPDGSFVFHGRRDHMVKIHGFRIELGEVEAALLAHPGIKEAVAFAVEQTLVSVLVPADGSLSVLDVKRHCASRLPKYMIPTDVRIVAGLPRTSNGKTDRVRTKAAVVDGDTSVLPPLARAGDAREA